MSSFLLSCHDMLIKCIKYIATTFFHIGFEIIFHDYSQLYSSLKHLVIDFLVAKKRIPCNDICHKTNPFPFFFFFLHLKNSYEIMKYFQTS
jgi:hypothetical protein